MLRRCRIERWRGQVRLAAAIAVVGLCQADTASAQSGFYGGKTITIIVGYGAGGGYDFYGRLLARHLGKYLEGSPTVIVRNMPGASGLAAANYLFNVASRDGTALGIINENAAESQVLGAPGIQYDSRKFNWLGRFVSGVGVTYAWHTSPAKTIEDVKVHELLIAATGAGANSAVLPYIMNQLIGTKFKIIPGYKGTNDGMLAMQRGEVGAYTSQWGVVKSQNRDWLQEKKINILVQYALEREPDLADVPTSVELSDKQEDRQVFALLASSGAVGRSLVAPPALPPERVAMLRAAFEAAMKDPKLLEEARLAGYDIKAMPGAKLQQVANSVFDIPADVVAKTTKLSARTK